MGKIKIQYASNQWRLEGFNYEQVKNAAVQTLKEGGYKVKKVQEGEPQIMASLPSFSLKTWTVQLNFIFDYIPDGIRFTLQFVPSKDKTLMNEHFNYIYSNMLRILNEGKAAEKVDW